MSPANRQQENMDPWLGFCRFEVVLLTQQAVYFETFDEGNMVTVDN